MNEYSEAAVEVLDILRHTNQYDLTKIPQSFVNYLRRIASKNYKVSFDHTKPIGELTLKPQTKELLGFIYITWWCGENEKEEYRKIIQDNKDKKKKSVKENVHQQVVFTQNNVVKEAKAEKQMSMVEYEKVSLFDKFFGRLFKAFRK